MTLTLVLTLVLTLALTPTTHSTTCTGNVPSFTSLATQTLSGCTHFTDDIILDSIPPFYPNLSTVLAPSPPASIVVDGSVYLRSLPSFTSFDGAEKFAAIHGGIYVSDNPTLSSLSPLSSLSSLGGLDIRNVPSLSSLAPLGPSLAPSLSTLVLHDLPLLSSLAPLANVSSVRTSVSLLHLSSLSSLHGLHSLSNVSSHLTISQNDALVSIRIPALAHVGHSITFSILPSLTQIHDFPHLASSHSVSLDILPALLDVGPWSGLTSAYSILLRDLPSLPSIPPSAFPSLTYVTQSVYFAHLSSLTSLSGFSSLSSTSGSVYLEDAPLCTSLSAFPALETIGNDLILHDLPSLTSVTAFPLLTSVANNLILTDLPNLPVLPPLHALSRVGSHLTIDSGVFSSLSMLDGLDGLTSVGGRFQLSGGSILHLDALSSLSSVGTLELVHMGSLTSASGLLSLVNVTTGGLIVSSAPALDALYLPSLTWVAGDLDLSGATALTSLDLCSLRSITGGDAILASPSLSCLHTTAMFALVSIPDGAVANTPCAPSPPAPAFDCSSRAHLAGKPAFIRFALPPGSSSYSGYAASPISPPHAPTPVTLHLYDVFNAPVTNTSLSASVTCSLSTVLQSPPQQVFGGGTTNTSGFDASASLTFPHLVINPASTHTLTATCMDHASPSSIPMVHTTSISISPSRVPAVLILDPSPLQGIPALSPQLFPCLGGPTLSLVDGGGNVILDDHELATWTLNVSVSFTSFLAFETPAFATSLPPPVSPVDLTPVSPLSTLFGVAHVPPTTCLTRTGVYNLTVSTSPPVIPPSFAALTVLPGPATRLRLISPLPTSADAPMLAGALLPTPLVFCLVDEWGNPVADASITGSPHPTRLPVGTIATLNVEGSGSAGGELEPGSALIRAVDPSTGCVTFNGDSDDGEGTIRILAAGRLEVVAVVVTEVENTLRSLSSSPLTLHVSPLFPDTPAIVSSSSGLTWIALTWAPPAFSGGYPVLFYSLTLTRDIDPTVDQGIGDDDKHAVTTTFPTLSPTTLQWNVSDLFPNTQYSVDVVATTQAGPSRSSRTRVLAATLPCPPTLGLGAYPSRQCTACSAGTYSDGTSGCVPCLGALFSRGGASSCDTCPTYAVCENGRAFAAPGYWYDASSQTYVKCAGPDLCSRTGCAPGVVPDSPLCAECQDGYAHVADVSTPCVKCPPRWLSITLTATGFVLTALFVAGLAKKRVAQSRTKGHRGAPGGGQVSVILSHIPLLLNHVHVLGLVLSSDGVPTSGLAGNVIRALTPASSSGGPLGSFPSHCALSSLHPFHVFAAYGGGGVTVLCVALAWRRSAPLLFATLFTLYPAISQATLSMFACRRVGGVLVLVSDVSVRCYDGVHAGVVAGAIVVALCVVLGIPALASVLIARGSHAGFGLVFLTQPFVASRRLAQHHELVITLTKVSLVAAQVFTSGTLQSTVGLALLASLVGITLQTTPYVVRSASWISIGSVTSSAFLLLFSPVVSSTVFGVGIVVAQLGVGALFAVSVCAGLCGSSTVHPAPARPSVGHGVGVGMANVAILSAASSTSSSASSEISESMRGASG